MAVTITAAELGSALGVDIAIATRLLPVATALVMQYAPTAPEAVGNEATIRAAGWLHASPKSGAVQERVGEVDTAYLFEATGCLRNSGAMSLLSPFKQRHAGAI